jgi:ubiquinone biosynthesis protein
MYIEPLERARDLGRLSEIAVVFARHGLGDVIRRAGLAPFFERAGAVLRVRSARGLAEKRPEVRLREAFEELGPAFVKLGQLLAGRSDILPRAWADELVRLREDVKPVPFEELSAQLTQDLGESPQRLFRNLDPRPLAAGSIAQVHRAELEDGTRVVLKIRRPGIEEAVRADLRLLTRFAERLEQHGDLRAYRPKTVIRHFARVLRGELDLAREARNAARLRATLPEGGPILVPRVHERWTRERLCIMDYLEGPSLGRWIQDGMPGSHDPARIARIGTEAVLRMVFVEGAYHADPHPGNVILLSDGRLGLIDFGQIGVLTQERRAEFLDLLSAVVSRNADRAAEVLLAWSDGRVDADELEQDCAEFIDRYRGRSLESLGAGELVADVNALARENGLVFPPDVALLLKFFLTLENLGRALEPAFVMSAHVEPFVHGTASSSRAGLRQVTRLSAELVRLAQDLPRDLRRLRSQLRRGRIGVSLDFAGLDRFSAQIDRSVNHLTIGMITAALIVGTSVSLTVSGGPRILELPFFGAVGFLSSIVVGIWWVLVTRRRS